MTWTASDLLSNSPANNTRNARFGTRREEQEQRILRICAFQREPKPSFGFPWHFMKSMSDTILQSGRNERRSNMLLNQIKFVLRIRNNIHLLTSMRLWLAQLLHAKILKNLHILPCLAFQIIKTSFKSTNSCIYDQNRSMFGTKYLFPGESSKTSWCLLV